MSVARRARTTGRHQRIQFGLGSGVSLEDPAVDMARYKNDIDVMVAAGQRWVRFGISSGEVTSGGNQTSITWDQEVLAMNDEAIAYARSKNIQVCLVLSGAPDYSAAYSAAQYRTITQVYWTFLINRYASQVALWHLFNEANGSHYQTFDSIDGSAVGQNNFPAGYLAGLSQLLADGRAIIKAANPGALLSTAALGYPMSADMQAEWEFYFDALAPNLDLISVHMYPDDSPTEIAAMGSRVAAMRTRYGKPVAVTEFGMPTPTGGFTQANQATYVPQMIASIKTGLPRIVILYEMRDQSASPGSDGELAFGIRLNNGTNKSGYTAIMAAMRGTGGSSSSSGPSGTGGTGGPLTDRTNVAYTNTAGTSSVGHIYAAGLDWTKKVGILVYGDGSAEFGLANPSSSYLLAGTNGLIAVAKKHNMVLVTPRAPGNGCTDGDGVCWYLPSNDGTALAAKIKWCDDFIRDQVLTKYNINTTRVCIAGYSSGAQLTSEYYGPQYASAWMEDGLLLSISYGGSPKVTASYPTAFKQAVAAVWDTGADDPAYQDSGAFGVQAGYDWYVSNGFTATELNVVSGVGHDRDGQFGGIVDREITQHVPAVT